MQDGIHIPQLSPLTQDHGTNRRAPCRQRLRLLDTSNRFHGLATSQKVGTARSITPRATKASSNGLATTYITQKKRTLPPKQKRTLRIFTRKEICEDMRFGYGWAEESMSNGEEASTMLLAPQMENCGDINANSRVGACPAGQSWEDSGTWLADYNAWILEMACRLQYL
jgi:hypothetical protein